MPARRCVVLLALAGAIATVGACSGSSRTYTPTIVYDEVASPTAIATPPVDIETTAIEFAAWVADFERERQAMVDSWTESTHWRTKDRGFSDLSRQFAERLLSIEFPARLSPKADRLYVALNQIADGFVNRLSLSNEELGALTASMKVWLATVADLEAELGIPHPTSDATVEPTPDPTPDSTPRPTPDPTPQPRSAPQLVGNFGGYRGGIGMPMSIECYTFFDDEYVEIRHSGRLSDTGRYFGDASGGAIAWDSGRTSTVSAAGRNLVIDGAKMTGFQTCNT